MSPNLSLYAIVKKVNVWNSIVNALLWVKSALKIATAMGVGI